jgi:hypothetical protein
MSRGRFKAQVMQGYLVLRKRRGLSSLARVSVLHIDFDFKPKLISGTNSSLVHFFVSKEASTIRVALEVQL